MLRKIVFIWVEVLGFLAGGLSVWFGINNYVAVADVIRILPLGDSITQGGRRERQEYTYRYPLYCMLRERGINVDFIGSLKTGLDPQATWPDCKTVPFDRDHEGHYGWTTSKVRDHLASWLQTYPHPPDVVLLHLGTNDQKASDFNQAIIEPLKDIIAMLRKVNPRVVIFVGHLNFNDGAALKIRPLVEAMATELSTEESPVMTVPFYQGWIEDPHKPHTDTFDWAHPNPQGQEKMAQKWYEAIKPFLKKLGQQNNQQQENSNR
ncbi:GDSL-type esterase/lipase family protein [Gloeothece verrucosa]|uniref:Lipolytic protein G-D-S-L family n=1 Tax=Gloeothece verrucosa (strain PCC 7822) TaxID=497965 RepID=E0U8D9_GLOV7|nr:GDSL-type esterase/lipase family protein [Gloeothece verrucosa]ADN12575.1 lipolytic protein G-D-S-L family [Gloeothece verrucosa PCC 7822]